MTMLAARVFWAYVKKWLGSIPFWVWVLLIVVGAGYWWGEHCRSAGDAAGAARVQAKFDKATHEWDGEKLRAALAAKQAESDARAEERRTATAQLEVIRDAHTAQVQRLQVDADAARGAAGKLRERVDTLAATAREAARNPAAAGGSAPAEEAIGLLAELQRRADERAGILARIADERGIAGEACERSYDSLTNTLTAPVGPGIKLGAATGNGGQGARGGVVLLASLKGTSIRATEFPVVHLQSPAGPPPFNDKDPPP